MCGQVFLKYGLSKNGGFWLPQLSFLENMCQLLSTPTIIIGIFLYLAVTPAFMYLLDHFELSYFYPWTAIMYVFAFIAAVVIFKETLNPARLAGSIIIVVGVIVISRS